MNYGVITLSVQKLHYWKYFYRLFTTAMIVRVSYNFNSSGSVEEDCRILQFVGAGFGLLEPISVAQQSIQVHQSDAGVRRGT